MIDYKKILNEKKEQHVAEFNAKLIPGDGRFLGIRLPELRKLAKDIVKDDWRSFIANVDDEYEEYKMLKGIVICSAKTDLDERLAYLKEFIPIVNNWAVCDTSQYKAKKDEKEKYWKFLQPYLTSNDEFAMRYAVVSFIGNFIEEDYIDRVLKTLNSVKHDGYYLKMGVAWTISVCFVKFPGPTMELLEKNDLDDVTYNKSLQKIIESYRVDDDMKNRIRSMKRKK